MMSSLRLLKMSVDILLIVTAKQRLGVLFLGAWTKSKIFPRRVLESELQFRKKSRREPPSLYTHHAPSCRRPCCTTQMWIISLAFLSYAVGGSPSSKRHLHSPLASFTFGAPFDAPSSQNIVVQVLRPACDPVIELHSIKCI